MKRWFTQRARPLLFRTLWNDASGQDLLEYAMLVGFITIVVAGFLPPALMPGVSTIFSKIASSLTAS